MRTIRNASVCVVGGAGFLGSHLVRHLREDRGCDVLVIDNLVTGVRRWIPKGCRFEHFDITGSEEHLLKLLKYHATQFVFNYAAEPYIPTSFERPLYVFNVNAFGALKVINAAQEAGCEGILQVSSAEIYGEAAHSGKTPETVRGINEDDQVLPHSSYGASKMAIDAMVQVRWREAKTPVIALRQFNCVGERETHPYVVPEIISQLHAHPDKVYLGNNSTRDFQYAGDAVRMATALLERGQFGEVYNMGSESCVRIYDLARMIGDGMGCPSVEVVHDSRRDRPWEIWHLLSDNSKLYGVIPERPRVSLERALQLTYGYFRDNGCRWEWEA